MTLNLTMPEHDELKPRITVFGVGGAGGNAVDNMIEKALEGVEFVVANTDAQALQQSRAPAKIQMGIKATEGLGAGAKATVGAAAAEESIEQIVDQLAGAHMCFITAGMGGGTGTGAAPIIAQAARELGVLTVGVVTKPFQFEGSKRMRQAEDGVEALQKVVDTLIIIPNQNLFRLANENTTFTDAFSLADDVLYQGVKGVTDLMVRPGLINLDFADVRAVMDEMGKAMMGTGEASGSDRAVIAAESAIRCPLLEDVNLQGAKGILVNITSGFDLTLFELDEAANRIREEVDPDANIIVGSTLDTTLEGVMRVSVVATGIDANQSNQASALPLRRSSLAAAATEVVEEAVGTEHQQAALEFPFEQEQPEVAQEPDHLFDDIPAPAELPTPAYQPKFEELSTLEVEDGEPLVATEYQPGTPSPEAMARLQAAVERAPTIEIQPKLEPQTYQDTPTKSKFGINSLISRMTGQSETNERTYVTQPSQMSSQAFETDESGNQADERIEIPAFLRRQAN